MEYDNPAGRLHSILVSLLAYPQTTAARDAWGGVFNLPKGELGPLLAEKVARTMLLPHEAVLMLKEEHPELAETYPSWVGQVVGGFLTHNLHGDMDGLKKNISSETLANLRITAALLHKGSGRKMVSPDDLNGIRATISELLSEVLESGIDERVKAYLVRSLRKMLTALEEYKLTGATEVLEVVERTVGHAMVDPEYRNFLLDSDLGKKVLDTLGAASNLMTVAVGLPQLTMAFQMLLSQG